MCSLSYLSIIYNLLLNLLISAPTITYYSLEFTKFVLYCVVLSNPSKIAVNYLCTSRLIAQEN